MLKVKVEDPNALRFIFQDELYLLSQDKDYHQAAPAPPPVIETPPVNFNYLGLNKKKLLILVHYPEHEFMPDTHLLALESVLGRKGHSRDDAAILNLSQHAFATHELLMGYFEPQTLLLLGKGSIPTGMAQLEFNIVKTHAGLQLLYTFSFDEMMTNNDNKKAFWEQMKSL